ncbi:MAG TPA: ABC transporter ATP-binding protein [Solirubrobacterales bacterium]|nr:ABC transporter ATP-binding protein [Solirubrobacterales bacterium]
MSLLLAGCGYRYAGASAASLRNVDLEIAPGEVVGVVGANGAGKSTLCLVASGLAPATIGGHLEGVVRIDDLETARARPHELAQRVGILFQNPVTQLSGMSPTVWEEIAFGPRNLGLPLDEVIRRVEEAAATFGIEAILRRDPERLSGGQAQLVALAGVLALQPRYLILDEPTSQLDPQGTSLVGEALRTIARGGTTGVLLAEHKTDLLDAICGRVLLLRDGTPLRIDAAAALLDDPLLLEAGVEPPARVRLARAAAEAGVTLPLEEATR